MQHDIAKVIEMTVWMNAFLKYFGWILKQLKFSSLWKHMDCIKDTAYQPEQPDLRGLNISSATLVTSVVLNSIIDFSAP